MTPLLRPVRPPDTGLLAEAHRLCFPEDAWSAGAFAEILAMPTAFGYLAHHDGTAAPGFALAYLAGADCEVVTLGVVPDWRRRGLGRVLVGALAAGARERGAAALILDVAEDNEAANRLYEKLGFLAAGRRPEYYARPHGAVAARVMRLQLADAAPDLFFRV